jgi:type I restriction-modification system DNA methylase subunit
MGQATHNKIVSFIWGIADDVLRDLFKRGNYPDKILPMYVIPRMNLAQLRLKTRIYRSASHPTRKSPPKSE